MARAKLLAQDERDAKRRTLRVRESPLAALQIRRAAADEQLAAERAKASDRAALRLRGSALADVAESLADAKTEAELTAAIDGMNVEIEMHDAACSWGARGGLVIATT